jgi:tetratricopeptide (TPR) repeat protein
MTKPLADNYYFWTPETDKTVSVGPDQQQVALPSIPLPIKSELCDADTPPDDVIGVSVYDYLRQFPDCPLNRQYAELLQDAYPHYLADLGSQIVMLDHKDVEAPYVKRKIVSMQILLLLEPENKGLMLQLGINFYELGLMFPELPICRSHFTKAMQYLAAVEDDAAALNYLARIDYLTGDLVKAIERWRRVQGMVADPAMQQAISEQIESLQAMGQPAKPLLEDLEAIGEAMRLMAGSDIEQAKKILEKLEEENIVPIQLPNPEFYYMLGVCREKTGDIAGAFGSYDEALSIDPDHEPSREGKERVTGGIR